MATSIDTKTVAHSDKDDGVAAEMSNVSNMKRALFNKFKINPSPKEVF